MKLFKTVALVLALSLNIGCDGSDKNLEEETTTLSFQDFVETVEVSVSGDAKNCGVVPAGKSDVEVNTCVIESFNHGVEFYAVYELQGFDSSVGRAITQEENRSLYLWSFDSNPVGGYPAESSKIEKEPCRDPEFSGSLDSGYDNLFYCK